MRIKQLIRNKEEYWEFVWPFVDWSSNPDKSLWREEDYPKLKLFFDKQHSPNEWTEEVKKSFDFYEECRAEYGDKNVELRDSVSGFSPDTILDAFGYDILDDDDGEYRKNSPMPLDKLFDVTFPFVVIGELYCSWDRLGDIKVLSIYHVSLKDFGD